MYELGCVDSAPSVQIFMKHDSFHYSLFIRYRVLCNRMPPGLTGVLINKIHPLTDTSRCLKRDDVILAFDDIPIANDGTGNGSSLFGIYC